MHRAAGDGSGPVVVAVSGGADSVALLDACVAANAESAGPGQGLLVAHVHHGVRGAAADADARFVQDLARSYGLPFRVLHADPRAVLKQGRASEARLRAERYRLLSEVTATVGAATVFTAHQRDDRVEGVILAALRDGSLLSLAGIRRRRRLAPGGSPRIVRPLLEISRNALAAFLAERGRSWREDESNTDCRIRRNFVRHALLPRLRGEDPERFDRSIVRLARLARVLAWRKSRGAVLRGDGEAVHARLCALSGVGVTRRASLVAQRLVQERASGAVQLDPKTRIAVRGGALERVVSIEPRPSARVCVTMHREGNVAPRLLAAFERVTPARATRTLYFDADRLSLPLCVRTRAPGDRFRPLGREKVARVKGMLIARRIPACDRDRLVVLADRTGIVAVEGLPPAERAKVTAATRRILSIRFEQALRDEA